MLSVSLGTWRYRCPYFTYRSFIVIIVIVVVIYSLIHTSIQFSFSLWIESNGQEFLFPFETRQSFFENVFSFYSFLNFIFQPRIDPLQLLKCLSVLLGPTGGIKSNDEVQRLASLMTKFSKKLVSKCIYIQILKTTNTDLLGQWV